MADESIKAARDWLKKFTVEEDARKRNRVFVPEKNEALVKILARFFDDENRDLRERLREAEKQIRRFEDKEQSDKAAMEIIRKSAELLQKGKFGEKL